MIPTVATAIAFLIAARLVRYESGVWGRYSPHVLAVSAALLITTLVRAATSGPFSQCALNLGTSGDPFMAKVHR
jgi:hypothetical protein